jgi:hypothetical protein
MVVIKATEHWWTGYDWIIWENHRVIISANAESWSIFPCFKRPMSTLISFAKLDDPNDDFFTLTSRIWVHRPDVVSTWNVNFILW